MKLPRIAVVGAGHMGRYHVRKFADLAREGLCELVGVADSAPERARALAEEHGVPVLADLPDVVRAASAACVAVSTLAHAEVAGFLLGAGLDVLVEKPLAATREQARAIIDAAQRGERVLQVGHVERFSPAFREVLPVLTRPRFIEAHRIGPYPARGAEVGVVLDLMIHDLDIVAELAGSEVVHVEAIGVPVLSTTEDIANARLRFANGCVLNLTASRVSLEPLRKIRVFQPDAYVSMDFASHEITVIRRSGGAAKIDVQRLRFDPSDALLAQDRAFVAAIAQRTGGGAVPAQPPSAQAVTGEEAYRALDLALRIQESMPVFEDLA